MRSHYCGDLSSANVGDTVELCGWVHRRRDHGGVIFLDVRDRTGLVQVVYDPDIQDSFATADSVRNEYVLRMVGKVRPRMEGKTNSDLATGDIEVLGSTLEILNAAATPPFQLDEYSDAGEDVRLKYRYMDLRRPEMQQRLQMRSKVSSFVRNYLEQDGYLDVETPTLTAATPEGARDYLVPSRTQPGQFFALPQSPQVFKQLLMMSGLDKYYQIARCYRDEDLRADRQPEFTQIDIEASFLTSLDIMNMAEGMLTSLFKTILDIDLPPFPVMTYGEAMRLYGSDKPDLRNPMQFVDIADLMSGVEFKVFNGPANDAESRVVALRAPGGSALSRKVIDGYTDFVGRYGAKGLAYIKVNDIAAGIDGLQSPILKFLPDDVVAAVLERAGAETGDIVFFGADKTSVVNDALGALRNQLGADLGLLTDGFAPLWVIDWPMFEKSRTGALTSVHHPFTRPTCTAEELRADPLAAKADAYDVVLNGHEVGGGSARIHEQPLQDAVFEALGLGDQAQVKFGFLLDALKFGCPPHGGIALGLDRLIMLMAGTDAIRDVIAFPKTQTASCLLTQAPSEVSETQLRELHLRLRPKAS